MGSRTFQCSCNLRCSLTHRWSERYEATVGWQSARDAIQATCSSMLKTFEVFVLLASLHELSPARLVHGHRCQIASRVAARTGLKIGRSGLRKTCSQIRGERVVLNGIEDQVCLRRLPGHPPEAPTLYSRARAAKSGILNTGIRDV